MTKKADTDPNFPPPSGPSEESLDALLDGLDKPFQLKPTAKQAESAGAHAVEYQAEARVPPARVEHNTFPDAPIIVSQTNPGVAPSANAPLDIRPEERARFEAMMLERTEEKAQRAADTSPRKTDPPGIATDPSRKPRSSSRAVAVIVTLVAIAVVGVVALHATSSPHTSDAAPSTTKTVTSSTATAATATITATATATETPTATATVTHQVAPVLHSTAPVHTASSPPATAHTSAVHPPATAVTTSEPTATVTAPPGFKPGN